MNQQAHCPQGTRLSSMMGEGEGAGGRHVWTQGWTHCSDFASYLQYYGSPRHRLIVLGQYCGLYYSEEGWKRTTTRA